MVDQLKYWNQPLDITSPEFIDKIQSFYSNKIITQLSHVRETAPGKLRLSRIWITKVYLVFDLDKPDIAPNKTNTPHPIEACTFGDQCGHFEHNFIVDRLSTFNTQFAALSKTPNFKQQSVPLFVDNTITEYDKFMVICDTDTLLSLITILKIVRGLWTTHQTKFCWKMPEFRRSSFLQVLFKHKFLTICTSQYCNLTSHEVSQQSCMSLRSRQRRPTYAEKCLCRCTNGRHYYNVCSNVNSWQYAHPKRIC